MLVLRLTRMGRNQIRNFRLIVQEKIWSPSSKVIEIIGNYNPQTNPATINFNMDRVKYWLSKGAQPSATVQNILINAGVMSGKKKRVVRGKKKKDEKAEAVGKVEQKPKEESATPKPAEVKTEPPVKA